MDKGKDLFVNDGYFMERFKRLQQENGAVAAATDQPISITSSSSSVALKPTTIVSKRPLEDKFNDINKGNPQTSGGKLAFSLKWKTKVTLAPVKFIANEEKKLMIQLYPEMNMLSIRSWIRVILTIHPHNGRMLPVSFKYLQSALVESIV